MVKTILDIPSFIFRGIALLLSLVLTLVHYFLWPILSLLAKALEFNLKVAHRLMAYAFGWSWTKFEKEIAKLVAIEIAKKKLNEHLEQHRQKRLMDEKVDNDPR